MALFGSRRASTTGMEWMEWMEPLLSLSFSLSLQILFLQYSKGSSLIYTQPHTLKPPKILSTQQTTVVLYNPKQTTPYTTVHKLPECISVFVCTSVQPSLKSTGNKYPRPHCKQTTTQCCQQSRCTVNNHKILSRNLFHGRQPHNTVHKAVSTVNNHKILSTKPLHCKQPHNTVKKPVPR